ncbi:MAG: hypothetical protein AAGI69_11120 [Cyanobacteria bacterium P01_H01_bin.21]
METPREIALLVMQKDDTHSDNKIQSIRQLMRCARLTPEGVLQYESEIAFYTTRKRFNKQLIKSGNTELMVLNAMKIVSQVLCETEIPSRKNTEDVQKYKKTVDEYSHYSTVLSPKPSSTSEATIDRNRRSSEGFR